VEWVVRELAAAWGGNPEWQVDDLAHPHEAQTLMLDWSKALSSLGWHPAIPLKQALRLTVDWYRRWSAGEDAREITIEQIELYARLANENYKGAAPAGAVVR
jgi:CDP-glucose 4,6-dehydratase